VSDNSTNGKRSVLAQLCNFILDHRVGKLGASTASMPKRRRLKAAATADKAGSEASKEAREQAQMKDLDGKYLT
jgi:hypothetical protein